MNLNLESQFNIAKKKNIILIICSFIISLSAFFIYFIYGGKATGIFNILVFGILQGNFFTHFYFPFFCLSALFIFPKLSLYQIQKQNSAQKMIKFLFRKSTLIGVMFLVSNLTAASIISIFWMSKIKLNIFRELIDLVLFVILQSWFLIIGFLINLVKQVTKKRIIIIVLIFSLILVNIYSIDNINLNFAFIGISSFFLKINYLDLLFQIIELPLSVIVVRETSEWILKIVDY